MKTFFRDLWSSYFGLSIMLFALFIATFLAYFVLTIWQCNRMQRFALAGFPPTLSERIQCEDVGVKVILVPNESQE